MAYEQALEKIERCRRNGAIELGLSNLGLTQLPPEIEKLTALERLYLQDNQLTQLPPEIGKLTALTTLYLYSNQLTQLPPEIGKLTALTTLNLQDNQLKQLPPEIGKLTALTGLDLQGNQLTQLPPEFGELTALTALWLQENPLTQLPPEIRKLTVLARLYLQRNFALGLPEDIEATQDASAILSYYFNTQQAARPLNEVKLVLCGRGATGKTSLVDRLLRNTFDPTKPETTGIALEDWTMKCGQGDITAHVWDFAGQVITHSMHQFFFSIRTVYVLVLTGREDKAEGDAEYWLKLIAAFGSEEGKGPPVIVALNKWDSTQVRVDRGYLRERYPFIVGFVETDCATGRGIPDMQRTLHGVVDTLPWVRGPFPKAWWGVKEALAQWPKPTMGYDEYLALCTRHEVTGEDAESLATVLHQLGLALNYRNDARLRDSTVLKPAWLTGHVYDLIRDAQKRAGTLSRSELAALLPDVDTPKLRQFLLMAMERFDLAYPVEDSAKWLVPLGLPDTQPEEASTFKHERDATRLRYRYTAMPEGLVPRFIVRTHPLIDGEQRWASGVILARDGARALVRAAKQDKQVEVTVTGPAEARQALAGLCLAEMRAIHSDIPGLNPVEESEMAGEWMKLSTVERNEALHQRTVVETATKRIELDPTKELNEYTAEAARDDSWKPRLFLSYSHADERYRKRLDIELKVLANLGLIAASWHDRKIQPGDKWDDEIKRELDDAEVIILLVSSNALASHYIDTVEMKRAIERANAREVEIIPIVVEPCLWTKGALGKFQGLPRDNRSVMETKPQKLAWADIATALHEKLKTLRERHRK